MMATHFFTSAATNYLPKARVLAKSIRRHYPAAIIHLTLCESRPKWFDLEEEPFDALWTPDDLDLPPQPGWLFSHNVVELSTAIKGFALTKLLKLPGCDSVIYFDPDIVVLASLDGLVDEFQAGSILLTPHSTEPDREWQDIEDNELVSLRHGTFNLGFLGVKNDNEGNRFAAWWRDRLRDFCFDNVPYGLFTDQRWADLVPSFFSGYRILKDAAYNVCTWNLNSRVVTGSLEEGLLVNGAPLVFYHFSGFDRGAQKMMLQRYGRHMPALFQLRASYKKACEEAGQNALGSSRWSLNYFENGAPILQSHRDLYRYDPRVREWFPDPYKTAGSAPVFADWVRLNGQLFSSPRRRPEHEEKKGRCYRIFVFVEAGREVEARHTLAHLPDMTASLDPAYLVGAEWSLNQIDTTEAFTKLPLLIRDGEDIVAVLRRDFSDRDMVVLQAGVTPPIYWDLRLAWSAARNEDALTISPKADGTADALAYWFREGDDPEIEQPLTQCSYICARPIDQVRGVHRMATHLCINGAGKEEYSFEIRTVVRAPMLHLLGEAITPEFEEFCRADILHEHLVLSPRGHAQHHGAAFRLSRFRDGALQKLESWPAAAPIRTLAMSHAPYCKILDHITEEFRPGEIVVWALLGHSLDALRTGLPITVKFDPDAISCERSICSEMKRLLVQQPAWEPAIISDNTPSMQRYFAGPKAPPRNAQNGLQLYWDIGKGFQEGGSTIALPRGEGRHQLTLQMPRLNATLRRLRLDVGTEPALVELFSLRVTGNGDGCLWKWAPGDGSLWQLDDPAALQQIVLLQRTGLSLRLACVGSDSNVTLAVPESILRRMEAGATVEVDYAFDTGDQTRSLKAVVAELESEIHGGRIKTNHLSDVLQQQFNAAKTSQQQAAQLAVEQAALREALDSLQSSLSWRITAPLRAMNKLLRPRK